MSDSDDDEVKTFEKAMEHNDWDKYNPVTDNVENFVDIFIEYQLEKLLKEYGKEHPNRKNLIDEISFNYL